MAEIQSQQFDLAPGVPIGGGAPLPFIAGPCVIESRAHCLGMARRLEEMAAAAGVPFVFKASFDKANRTAADSYRGPGMAAGLEILRAVKAEVGVAVLTDVHEREQCGPVAAVVDVLQIPAFLCRQTDLIFAAADTGKPINVKKGQFSAPWDMVHVIEKCRSRGNEKLTLCERGASFGYGNLVVDMRSLPMMRRLGVPVIYDATHSLQLPATAGRETGGMREFAIPLARAAVSVGIDGIFMEVHDNPEAALSDRATQLPVESARELMRLLPLLDRFVRDNTEI